MNAIMKQVSADVQRLTSRPNSKSRSIYSITLLSLDNAPQRKPQIFSNVLNGIHSADLMLADVSPDLPVLLRKSDGERPLDPDNQDEGIDPEEMGEPPIEERQKSLLREPNVNVMNEIGIAMGLQIPLVLIGESGVSHNLPSNIKSHLVTEYPAWLGKQISSDRERGDGQSKITDADLKTILGNKGVKEFIKKLTRNIYDRLVRMGPVSKPSAIRVGAYRQRRHVGIPEMLKNARNRIYILTTNLEYIHTRMLRDIEHALVENLFPKNFEDRNGSFKVDILSMDPESVVTNARAKQLNEDVATYRNRLRESLQIIKDFREAFKAYYKERLEKARKDEMPVCMQKWKPQNGQKEREYHTSIDSNIEINTYVTLPTLIMFVIDDVVVWSAPFPSLQSRLAPHFVASSDEVITQQFVSYFFSVKSQSGGQVLL